MRGHTDLIAMRRHGVVPRMVYVDTDPGHVRHDHLMPFDPDFVQVFVDPKEHANLLDLRCLVGLTVQVSGLDATRVAAITAACVDAKAGRVIGVTHERVPYGSTFEVVAITDTEGAMQWPTS